MKSLKYDGDHPVKGFKSCSEYKIIHFVVSSPEKQQRAAMLTSNAVSQAMRGAVRSKIRDNSPQNNLVRRSVSVTSGVFF